jgi:hypothetical protein
MGSDMRAREINRVFAIRIPVFCRPFSDFNLFLSILFALAGRRAIVVSGMNGDRGMPKHIGQWTGLVVTTIIVLGCDMDVIYAMPLGIMAGALATFFVALADSRIAARAKD